MVIYYSCAAYRAVIGIRIPAPLIFLFYDLTDFSRHFP